MSSSLALEEEEEETVACCRVREPTVTGRRILLLLLLVRFEKDEKAGTRADRWKVVVVVPTIPFMAADATTKTMTGSLFAKECFIGVVVVKRWWGWRRQLFEYSMYPMIQDTQKWKERGESINFHSEMIVYDDDRGKKNITANDRTKSRSSSTNDWSRKEEGKKFELRVCQE